MHPWCRPGELSEDERPDLLMRSGLFYFGGAVTEETQTPTPQIPKPSRFDRNDYSYIAGLILLGIGLAFSVSWAAALVVVGATLAAVGLVNSYVIVWKSR